MSIASKLAQTLALPVRSLALERRLRARLELVEKQLVEQVQTRHPFVTEAASHLLEAGGKRFRPVLVLLTAELGPHADSDDVLTAACVVELTHLASLYHDDVMDDASVRRNTPSANAAYGNNVAILTGDLLFARSSELTAGLGPEAVGIQARTFAQLVEGQILEDVPPAPGVDPIDHHLEVVAGKTGILLATSARYGAMFGGASPEVVEAVASYGAIVGVAFQVSDDIIDIASDVSGKTPGTDLREGIPTLPVLLALRTAQGRFKDLLDLAVTTGIEDDAEVAEVLAELRRHPALDEARAFVAARAEEAKQALAVLPGGPVREALELFADSVADRSA